MKTIARIPQEFLAKFAEGELVPPYEFDALHQTPISS